jgi:hypothetical protein
MTTNNRLMIAEATVEAAALEWFEELGYAVGHGSHLTPGEHVDGFAHSSYYVSLTR